MFDPGFEAVGVSLTLAQLQRTLGARPALLGPQGVRWGWVSVLVLDGVQLREKEQKAHYQVP